MDKKRENKKKHQKKVRTGVKGRHKKIQTKERTNWEKYKQK